LDYTKEGVILKKVTYVWGGVKLGKPKGYYRTYWSIYGYGSMKKYLVFLEKLNSTFDPHAGHLQ
jgi:hypothetical protein